jgi:protein disulfide-isomerase A1
VPIIRLQSKDSAEEFLKKDMTFVIGLFKNFEVLMRYEMLDAEKMYRFQVLVCSKCKNLWNKLWHLFNLCSLISSPHSYPYFWQGADHEEFVKAATTDNEVQFVETSDTSVAKVLFPGITSEEKFVGLVKSEPEKFEKFGKYFVKFTGEKTQITEANMLG